jgi:hypothetical protein
MKFKIGLLAGFGIGYLVGTGKAEQLLETARQSFANRDSHESQRMVPGDYAPRPTMTATAGPGPVSPADLVAS